MMRWIKRLLTNLWQKIKMKNNVAYKNLSRFYQRIILDDGYEFFTDYVLNLVNQFVKSKRGIDVGCGTGIFTRKLKKAGYDVIGVDISPDMIAVADEETVNSNLKILYQIQDVKSLKSFEKVGFITAVNDVFNYLDLNGLKKAFSSISKNLQKGGAFIFDVSTEYKLEKILGENMFGDDNEDLSYIWVSEYDKQRKTLDMNLSFFEKNGSVYNRYDESQTQHAHSVADIENALKLTNFTLLKACDGAGNTLSEISERAIFVAIKN